MTTGSQVKVGAVVIGGFVLLGLAVYLLLGWGANRGRYRLHVIFSEAVLQPRDEVRMAGVAVGAVDRVALTRDQRAARVTLLMDPSVHIREGDRVEAASAVALEKHWVEIHPGPGKGPFVPPGSTIRGTRAPEIRDIVAQAQDALGQLGETAENVNRILGDERIMSSVLAALGQLADLAVEARALARALEGLQQRTEPRIARALAAAEQASLQIASAAKEADKALSAPEIKQIEQKTARALDTLDRTGQQLDQALQDVRKIVNQPGLAEDVRAAVKKTTEAMDSLKAAGESIKQTAGTLQQAGKLAERVSRLGAFKRPQVSGSLDLEYITGLNDAWIEGNVNLDFGNRLMRLGLTDVGGADKLNLQLGTHRGKSLLRLGLIQSELGVGYDAVLGRRFSLGADLFDPHQLRLNLLGYYTVRDGYDLVLGRRDVDNEGHLTLGVRVSR